ncbi:MAG: hypothetical protein WD733_00870, partial [Bryobacterales bacterium]
PKRPQTFVHLIRGHYTSIESRILKTSHREYQVVAATESIVQIETYHAPGWSASLNMQPVAIRVDGETGLQLITVPPGTHRLQLEYRLSWPWERRKHDELAALF